MKTLLFSSIFISFSFLLSAQDFKGQWKGEFVDQSTSFINWGGDKCDYVLELESVGNKVQGYSYTYFSDGGKKYYTICRVKGFINRKEKYIEVRETERTKTNVPNTVRNCFQTHKLTYEKLNGTETLVGNWVPAPDQDGDCGFGFTTLTRRILQTTASVINPRSATTEVVKKPTTPPSPGIVKLKPKTSPIVKQPAPSGAKPSVSEKTIAKKSVTDHPETLISKQADQRTKIPAAELNKRNFNVLKTLEVKGEMVRVDLYDNGEIDGDSISLFYNGKMIASRKRLNASALTFQLPVDKDAEHNELVMYAENLGSIPPNTALMVVTDGVNRYEVRITSDLQKSGVIQFVHHSKILGN
jgi:hypothetical protein